MPTSAILHLNFSNNQKLPKNRTDNCDPGSLVIRQVHPAIVRERRMPPVQHLQTVHPIEHDRTAPARRLPPSEAGPEPQVNPAVHQILREGQAGVVQRLTDDEGREDEIGTRDLEDLAVLVDVGADVVQKLGQLSFPVGVGMWTGEGLFDFLAQLEVVGPVGAARSVPHQDAPAPFQQVRVVLERVDYG